MYYFRMTGREIQPDWLIDLSAGNKKLLKIQLGNRHCSVWTTLIITNSFQFHFFFFWNFINIVFFFSSIQIESALIYSGHVSRKRALLATGRFLFIYNLYLYFDCSPLHFLANNKFICFQEDFISVVIKFFVGNNYYYLRS